MEDAGAAPALSERTVVVGKPIGGSAPVWPDKESERTFREIVKKLRTSPTKDFLHPEGDLVRFADHRVFESPKSGSAKECCFEAICQTILSTLCSSNPKVRLHMLYGVSSLIRHGKRKKRFAILFEKELTSREDAFLGILAAQPNKDKVTQICASEDLRRLGSLLATWSKEKIFAQESCDRIEEQYDRHREQVLFEDRQQCILMNAVTTARAVEVMPKQNDPEYGRCLLTVDEREMEVAAGYEFGSRAGGQGGLDRLYVRPPAGTSREVQFRYPGADYELKAVSPPSPDLWRPLLDPSGDLSVDWPSDKESLAEGASLGVGGERIAARRHLRIRLTKPYKTRLDQNARKRLMRDLWTTVYDALLLGVSGEEHLPTGSRYEPRERRLADGRIAYSFCLAVHVETKRQEDKLRYFLGKELPLRRDSYNRKRDFEDPDKSWCCVAGAYISRDPLEEVYERGDPQCIRLTDADAGSGEGDGMEEGEEMEPLGAEDLEKRTHSLEVHGITRGVREEDVRDFFRGFDLEKVTFGRDVTYVYFYSVEDASSALERARGRDLRGTQVDVRVNRNPRWKLRGESPPRRSEEVRTTKCLEVRNLPRGCEEKDVEALFGGHDVDVIVLDPDQLKAYVYFYSVEDAAAALQQRQGGEVLGRAVDLRPDPNPRSTHSLEVHNLEEGTREDDVRRYFRDYRVDSCMVINSRDNRGRGKQWRTTAYVYFSTVGEAREAMLAIGGHGVDFGGGKKVDVIMNKTPRHPMKGGPSRGPRRERGRRAVEAEAEAAEQAKCTHSLIIKDHPMGTTEGEVREFFTGRQIERVTCLRSLVYVDFASVEEARRALSEAKGKNFKGSPVKIRVNERPRHRPGDGGEGPQGGRAGEKRGRDLRDNGGGWRDDRRSEAPERRRGAERGSGGGAAGGGQGSHCLMMREVPRDCGDRDVRRFFGDFRLDRIVFQEGGVARVYFYSVEDASRALESRNGQELFGRLCQLEVDENPYYGLHRGGGGGAGEACRHGVIVRGLPREHHRDVRSHLLDFFDGLRVTNAVVARLKREERPGDLQRARGDAYVYFRSVEDAERAVEMSGRALGGGRWLEIKRNPTPNVDHCEVCKSRGGGRADGEGPEAKRRKTNEAGAAAPLPENPYPGEKRGRDRRDFGGGWRDDRRRRRR